MIDGCCAEIANETHEPPGLGFAAPVAFCGLRLVTRGTIESTPSKLTRLGSWNHGVLHTQQWRPRSGAAWLAFLRSLVARSFAGVWLVSSDAHAGLSGAIAAMHPSQLAGGAAPNFMCNLLTRVPKSASLIATMARTVFAQPDAEMVHEQHRRIFAPLVAPYPKPQRC